jgi:3-oxoacyl-[acyl-carrier-protein] synthase III
MLKKFNNTVIESFGYYLPESVMTSDEIEDRLTPVYDRLKLPKGRLELQTGIKSRRYWDRGAKPSDLSTRAALECFKTSSIRRDNIDLLIHASVCRDFLEPATASVVHRNLELKSTCNFFDLSNACLGVMSSILLAANMIENGAINSALIVSGENGGPLLFETIDQLNNDTSLTRKSIKS